jgi:hypothetical protein
MATVVASSSDVGGDSCWKKYTSNHSSFHNERKRFCVFLATGRLLI